MTTGKVVVLIKYQSVRNYEKATFHYIVTVLQDMGKKCSFL